MARYLPFGKEMIATDEQMKNREEKFKRYETYGIPYGILDGMGGEEKRTTMEKDREQARILIMQGKDIPKDLEKRLLTYKKMGNSKIRIKSKVSKPAIKGKVVKPRG